MGKWLYHNFAAGSFHTKKLLCYLLRLRRYKRKSVELGVFEGVGHFERKFQTEVGVAH